MSNFRYDVGHLPAQLQRSIGLMPGQKLKKEKSGHKKECVPSVARPADVQ